MTPMMVHMCDFTGLMMTGFIKGAAAAANRSVSQSVVGGSRSPKGEGQGSPCFEMACYVMLGRQRTGLW